MLINCPKCGFQQPKDKYCAQCGVDMETFRPAKPPFFQRVFGNPIVPLSILIVMVSGIGFFMYKSGQENLQNRVTYLKSSVQIESSTTSAANTDEQVLSASGDTPPPPPPPTPTHSTEVASTIAGNEAVDPAAKAFAGPTPAAEKPKTTQIVVYYAEVGRGMLGDFVNSSRGTGQYLSFNDYSAGILPGINKALTAPTVKILHKEQRSLSQKSNQWFLGWTDKRDPSRQIGLNTYFEVNDMEAGNLRGNIEILRTWREETAPGIFEVHKRTFPAIFEIGGETGFFMWGVMPRRSNLPNEDELVEVDVYKILRSPQFRSHESEFVIFVEFERSQ